MNPNCVRNTLCFILGVVSAISRLQKNLVGRYRFNPYSSGTFVLNNTFASMIPVIHYASDIDSEKSIALVKRARYTGHMENISCEKIDKACHFSKKDAEFMGFRTILETFQGSRSLKLLLEGAPGCGKTFLSHHIISEWAANIQNSKWEMVLYILLHAGIQRLSGIKELVKHFLDDEAYDHTCTQIVQHLTSENGNGLLIIIDGLDDIKMLDEGNVL